MMRAATILWAILAAVAGTALFMLKYEVQAQEQRLENLRKDIAETQESIHVLKAEWSYLNAPSRLREQAERHLGLHPLKPSQIVTIASLPMNDPKAPDAPVSSAPSEPEAAPVVTIPQIPNVTRRAPVVETLNGAGARRLPAPKAQPLPAPAKPGHSMMAAQAIPQVNVKSATAKTAALQKEGKVSAAAPHPTVLAASRPAAPAAPQAPSGKGTPQSKPPTVTSTGDVMVIKSPALAEPEVASTGVRP
jgi:hypothetical protein